MKYLLFLQKKFVEIESKIKSLLFFYFTMSNDINVLIFPFFLRFQKLSSQLSTMKPMP
jgi:hypothetical protein